MNKPSNFKVEAQRHRQRLEPLVHPHLKRRSLKIPHPVFDFLFEYYSFRPSQLLEWSPGFEHPEIINQHFSKAGKFPTRRIQALEWVVELLQRTMERTPRYQCFGLHEWAMVYNEQDVRHKHLKLRLPHAEIRALIEQSPLRCSHVDAFRFFSKEAKPMNAQVLTRANQVDHEQPGCLHANMDLYKWAYKFYPWTPSDLIADGFELAWRIREMDMRASPYDLSHLGFTPLTIETREGREAYAQLQQGFAEEAQVLREKLLKTYTRLLESVSLTALPES